MAGKQIKVTFYNSNHIRPNWKVDVTGTHVELFLTELADDLARFGIELEWVHDDAVTIDIKSYADLLNSIRITSVTDGFSSICVGHVIDKSPNLDLFEDMKRAVNRVAFAPETIAPDEENRKVCHNCGCGC